MDRSLDRIDCFDKEYGSRKVRWATPREQANNRKNTHVSPTAQATCRITTVFELRCYAALPYFAPLNARSWLTSWMAPSVSV
ncbi:hypothetical protein C8J34_1011219 [Rhizobium sp. PP-F2F-G36]|nr:hypothetical protein C8J34_1011219 [Rhizobium sp. PP-F2F-G36]